MNSTAIIHLSNIDKNIEAIERRLKPGVQKMAVIKDNAYGHGLLRVASHLSSRVDWFCVARVDEAKALRESGIENPILVFESPRRATAELYSRFNITATLTELDSLDIMTAGTQFHINIDTGMHRLGVLPSEVSSLRQAIDAHSELQCTGIYTHFFKADDPGNTEVGKQLKLFNEIRAEFPSELMTHTANTGGIFHYTDLDLQFDAVRPGICLYGYGAGDSLIDDLHPVMDLRSYVMQIKRIPKGDTVSYGGRWTAPEDGNIAIIPAGYSDGIPRVLSDQIEVLIGGKRYAQAGTISMDYSIVWLGDDSVPKNTEVYFLSGKTLNAMDWARKANTIPYEITTNIKGKVNRQYEL